ncbi:hypothetical protein LTR66_013445, partial [Elasticomyces elasticus]
MSHVHNNQLDAFTLYHQLRESTSSPSALPALTDALTGSAATALSHLLIYPLNLLITRLQVQRQLRGPREAAHAARDADAEYAGVWDAARKVFAREGGVAGFYVGAVADTGKSLADAFLFFLAYGFLRRRRNRARTGTGAGVLAAGEELRIGILAGAFARLLTTPVQNVVTRKQTAALVAARSPGASAREPS